MDANGCCLCRWRLVHPDVDSDDFCRSSGAECDPRFGRRYFVPGYSHHLQPVGDFLFLRRVSVRLPISGVGLRF